MGDRVVVVVTDGNEIAPAIYAHWLGSEAPAILVKAGEAGLIRKDDESYAAARVCGAFHEASPGHTGVGLLDAPADLSDETLEEFSHGDAGVIVLNVSDGSLRYVGGYGEGRPASVNLTA